MDVVMLPVAGWKVPSVWLTSVVSTLKCTRVTLWVDLSSGCPPQRDSALLHPQRKPSPTQCWRILQISLKDGGEGQDRQGLAEIPAHSLCTQHPCGPLWPPAGPSGPPSLPHVVSIPSPHACQSFPGNFKLLLPEATHHPTSIGPFQGRQTRMGTG